MAVAILRNSSNMGYVPREFSQVFQHVPQKSDSGITCIVSSDRKWRETGWFDRVSTSSLQGEMKTLLS